MTWRTRRVMWAAGLAVSWYAFVVLVLVIASWLFGAKHNILWLWKILLFPADLLNWLEVKLIEWFGVPGPGHLVLTKPFRTAVSIGYPSLHFGFVMSVAYWLLSWRAAVNGRSGRA